MGADLDLIDSIDIFAAVELSIGSDQPDPLPVYRELLAEHPVYRGDLLVDRLGLHESMLSPWDGPRFTVLGFDEVAAIHRDDARYSVRAMEPMMGPSTGRNILLMDDPDHRAHRILLQRAFTKAAMDTWRVDFIEPLVETYIDGFIDQGSSELMRSFARTFPVSVIYEMLGMPAEQLSEMHRLAAGLLLFTTHPDVALACGDRLGELVLEHVEQRRTSPTSDLLSILANEELSTGERLTDDEVVSFVRLLLPAGAETTTRLIGSLLTRVLTQPGLVDELIASPGKIPLAVEETLRLHPPFQYGYRLCLEDTMIADVEIPAGATIATCIASAHRDPRRFSDPDRFDLDRGSSHLAFGLGAHTCLGIHLARVEAAATLAGFLTRLPDLRLDPSEPEPIITGIDLSSVDSVNVVWSTT